MKHTSNSKTKATGGKNRLALFAISQLALVPAIAFATFWGRDDGASLSRRPRLRNEPRVVAPLYNYPLVISDEQLESTLRKLLPPQKKGTAKINHIDHALRFWGADAVFDDANVLSGAQMRAILMRDEAFRIACGPGARALVVRTPDGLRFRTQEGSATASHVDHSLATLAEVGTPLEQRLTIRDGASATEVALGEVVQDALGRFGLNQQEYEWTATVLGLYAADFDPWESSDGERISMDRIADRIMRQDFGQGCCYGGHRLFTLTVLLRLDETEQFFSEQTRRRIVDHLSEATCRLTESQASEGFWDHDWPGERIVLEDDLGELARRLSTTGHALEWWALAPRSCQPPRECVIRAAQWIVAEIDKMDEPTVTKNYTFLTHVGRALALWRGDFPAQHWQRLANQKRASAGQKNIKDENPEDEA